MFPINVLVVVVPLGNRLLSALDNCPFISSDNRLVLTLFLGKNSDVLFLRPVEVHS